MFQLLLKSVGFFTAENNESLGVLVCGGFFVFLSLLFIFLNEAYLQAPEKNQQASRL